MTHDPERDHMPVEAKRKGKSGVAVEGLGQRVRALRKGLRWTLRDLSLRTGLAVPTLSEIENSQVSISVATLKALCEALGRDPNYLVLGDADEDRIYDCIEPMKGHAMDQLTTEQKACGYDTLRHIERVRIFLDLFAAELLKRGEEHDQSKLKSPEIEAFTELTPKLAAATFGTHEYEGLKAQLGEALTHHYASNRHHPEHHANGVDDMNLIDVLEMFADWKAASERHLNGDFMRSINTCVDRFKIGPQLASILRNTASVLLGQ